MHLGLNVANDVFDTLSGADAANVTPTQFSGGSRVVHYGLVKLREAADSHVAAVQELFEERFSEDELGQLGALLARLPGAEGTVAESCSP